MESEKREGERGERKKKSGGGDLFIYSFLPPMKFVGEKKKERGNRVLTFLFREREGKKGEEKRTCDWSLFSTPTEKESFLLVVS